MIKYLSMMVAVVAGVTLLVASTPVTVGAATSKDDICRGVNLGNTGGCDSTSGDKVSNVVAVAVNIFSLIVGIVAIIMIIVSGLKYVTSSGDSNSVNSAKNTILYAVVGLIIVALAQFIVRFVLAKATNTPTPP